MPEKPFLLLLPFMLLALLSGCAGMGQKQEPPKVNLVNLRVVDMQLFEQRYGLTLRVVNPNQSALTIEGISFEIELNEQEFAYGVSRQALTVPGFCEATLEVEVISTLFNVVNQLQNLESRTGKPLQYRIHGKIGIAGGLFSIPFENEGQIGPSPTGSPGSENSQKI
ncbi:MAG: LEA type 2 family protein [Gammaproteobacteria bacterium]|nr:LEA type 2 family protein [Gammaproteobacteria bacterium]